MGSDDLLLRTTPEEWQRIEALARQNAKRLALMMSEFAEIKATLNVVVKLCKLNLVRSASDDPKTFDDLVQAEFEKENKKLQQNAGTSVGNSWGY